MKPTAFAYRQAASVAEALRALAASPDAKVMAGGQTLGPMLNLRLAQPAEIIDITRIPELGRVTDEADAITFGAVVTHAAIEDRRAPDPTGGFMARVAHGIGYRAVRTRGTIGGSLAHADPAADWLSCLSVLGAEIVVASTTGSRRVPVARFVRGALDTELDATELVTAVRVPRYSPRARFGYHKICRKEGEFADAIGAAVQDPEKGIYRMTVSSTTGAPAVLESTAPFIADELPRRLADAGIAGDAYERRLSLAVLQRALAEAAP